MQLSWDTIRMPEDLAPLCSTTGQHCCTCMEPTVFYHHVAHMPRKNMGYSSVHMVVPEEKMAMAVLWLPCYISVAGELELYGLPC